MITRAPRSTKVLIWLAKKYINKISNSYYKKHDQKLPIILVAGTAGKSSTTFLIKQLFQNNSWEVFSGASQESCLNSLSGIVMVLTNNYPSFEGNLAGVKKAKFVLTSLLKLFTISYDLPKESIFVYEVGFNEQNEANYFLEVFSSLVSELIITNLTYEHSEGFARQFDQNSYDQIKLKLPVNWRKIFENSKLDPLLKNIALEQFKLAKLTKKIIIPDDIGNIKNSLQSNLTGTYKNHKVITKRGPNFSLLIENKFAFSDEYLLPITFGKYIYILALLSSQYELNPKNLIKTLKQPQLPNGRFGILQGQFKTTIIDSTYNSDPSSLIGYLELFKEVVTSFKNWEEYISKNPDPNNPINSPKHYLILGEMRELGDTSIEAHSKILVELMEIGKQYRDYIQEIILIGREWLKCDQNKIPKTHGDINYITFNNQIFKVYLRSGDVNKTLTPDTVRPHSWFWLKGSQNTIFLEITAQHLLQNPKDQSRLCRRGEDWDQIREEWS